MYKKFILFIGFMLLTTHLYAHSGRLDSVGGHRVNTEWVYEGQYIEIKNNIPELKKEKILFKQGDYHFHCRPSANKIDLTHYRDGVYLPIPEKEVKNTATSNIHLSEENVVASKTSRFYHTPKCRYIKNIKEENIVIFTDKEEAVKAGYMPHKKCKAGEIGGKR
jgi:hypothetical protein